MGIAPDDHIDLLNVRHVAPAHDDAEGNAALEEPWSVQRDRGAADRDRAAQARDETALDRDLEQARADQRARTRDRAAAERDCAAHDRDLKASRLDHSEGDADEQTVTGRRAAMDRVSAALDIRTTRAARSGFVHGRPSRRVFAPSFFCP